MSSVAVSGATIDQAPEPRWPGPVILSTPVLANTTPAPVASRASNEGYPKVPEDFTIKEKAPSGALVGAFSVITNLFADLRLKLYREHCMRRQ